MKSLADRNVRMYKLFAIFNEPLFWGPILIASMQKLGKIDLPSIYFCEAVAMLLLIVLDIPTSALADVVGRKRVLIIGRVFLVADMACFAAMDGPVMAWVANLVWAVGYSFQSSADQALIYNSLKKAGREKDFMKIEGSAAGTRYILIGLCSLAVGPLAAIDLRLPLILSVPCTAIPLIASFFFQENRNGEPYSVRAHAGRLVCGTLFAWRKTEVRWIIGLCALLAGASKIWFFTYNPYFEKVGVSLEYYGLIFFLLNMVAWLCSRYAYRLELGLPERSCVAGMILCTGLPILAMGLFPCWQMVTLVLIQNVTRGFMGPFVGKFMNRHIDSEDVRTTALSVRSTLTNLISVGSLSLFGLMDERLGLLGSLIVLGIAVLIIGKWSYARYTRLFPATAPGS
jgi:MFS family permease